ncbi:MAG: FtsX-like permease family protein [Peptoniphilaceae bacterium]
MNKKNFSIIMSVFIASFVVTILGYIIINQNMEKYYFNRINMPEDILVYKLVNGDTVSDIKKIKNVKKVGLKSEDKSVKIKNEVSRFTAFDEEYFSMQYKFLKEGEMPENLEEIVISESMKKDLGLNLGDKVNLEFGNRYLRGELIDPDKVYNKNEVFKNLKGKTYKIVGIYEDKNNLGLKNIFGFIGNKDGKYYPCLKLDNLSKAYETKDKIKTLLDSKYNENVTLILNEGILRFFHILEEGSNPTQFILSKLVTPFVLILIFVFMIKNIFNIWAIHKIKELSMYKSIGATNFQIYKLLLKDSLKISLIPLILGEIIGFVVMKLTFNKIFSLKRALGNLEYSEYYFNYTTILIISITLLLIISLAVSFPARTVSKIEILEGLRENISFKNYKKRISDNLFKELKINNRKILKPALIIMTAGLVMVQCMFYLITFDKYNTERSKINKDFNFNLRYSTKNNAYPEIFNKIKKEFKPEKSLVSIEKRFYVNSSNLKYSREFNDIGFDNRYKQIYYYPESNLLDGILIGLEEKEFEKISKNKNDLVLVNCVQKDPKEFYREAEFIPYLDNSVKKVKIRYLEDFKGQDLKIDKKIDKLIENQNPLFLYSLEFVTSIDNFQNILKNGEEEFKNNNMELPRIYYNLEMKFKEEDILLNSKKIENLMENNIRANEKYYIRNMISERENSKINKNGMLFLLLLVLVSSIFLNIANTYSATNLLFFNRKKEIGILLSNGMEKEDLEKLLEKEMKENIISSLLVSFIITYLIIGYLIYTIPYIDIFKYLSMVEFGPMIIVVILISLSSYLIYTSAMNKITKKEIIELLKVE